MGYFKEIEIEKMAVESARTEIKFEVAQMLNHLRMTQAQLRALRKKNMEAQSRLPLQPSFKMTSGF